MDLSQKEEMIFIHNLSPLWKSALLGTTVSPGFEWVDYESGQRDDLVKSYPPFRDLIIALTKQ